MNKVLKIAVVAIFWGWVVLLGLQIVWPFMPTGRKLAGVVAEIKPVELSWTAIKNGSWPRSIEKQYDSSFRVRPFLVRLDNEICMRLFQECPFRPKSSNLALGTNNVLYEIGYIRAVITPTPYNTEQAKQRIERLVRVQDLITALDKAFCVVICPSKSEIYPEFVPSRFWSGTNPDSITTTYEQSVPLLTKSRLKYIDSVALFKRWKLDGDMDLFPQSGTHWSFHGAYKILQLLPEMLNGQMDIHLASPSLESEPIAPPFGTDRDILNLSNPLNHDYRKRNIPHPIVNRIPDSPAVKPRIFWVGNSFTWTLTKLALDGNLLDLSTVAYYNKTLFDVDRNSSSPIDDRTFNLKSFLNDYDAVVLVIPENSVTENEYDFLGCVESQLGNKTTSSARTDSVWQDSVIGFTTESSPESHGFRFGKGFSHTESFGTWTNGDYSVLYLPSEVSTVGDLRVEIDVYGFLIPTHPEQRIEIRLGAQSLYTGRLLYGEPGIQTIKFIIPGTLLEKRRDMRFILPDASSPKDNGLSVDTRKLGVGIKQIGLFKVVNSGQ